MAEPWEWTATEAMPIFFSVRITRTAISPRFATRTLLNIALTP